jgi:hypothetical protein
MKFPLIPTLIGGIVGSLVSEPLGSTPLQGILAGGLLGAVGAYAMQERATRPMVIPVIPVSPAAVPPPAAVLPDGQLVTPPSTPGELHEQEAEKLADWSRASSSAREAEREAVEVALLEETAQWTPQQLLGTI